MGKKLKFMLLTLLGFSAACSSVRNGTGSDTKTTPEEAPEVQQVDTIRTIRVLYGVRRPRPVPKAEIEEREQNGSEKPDTTEKSR